MHTIKDTRGSIVVETVLAFIPFTLIMLGIVMLINVVSMQSRVHYALTQTAMELSIMSYLDLAYEDGRPRPRPRAHDTFTTVFGVANELSAAISSQITMVAPETLQIYFDFEVNAVTQSHIAAVFGRHLGGEWLPQLYRVEHYFCFEESEVTDTGSLILRVTYYVAHPFTGTFNISAGDLTRERGLRVRQTVATRLWRSGCGQGSTRGR